MSYSTDGRNYKKLAFVDGYAQKGKTGYQINLANYIIAKGTIKGAVMVQITLNADLRDGTYYLPPKGKCSVLLLEGDTKKVLGKGEGFITIKAKTSGTFSFKSETLILKGSYSGITVR